MTQSVESSKKLFFRPTVVMVWLDRFVPCVRAIGSMHLVNERQTIQTIFWRINLFFLWPLKKYDALQQHLRPESLLPCNRHPAKTSFSPHANGKASLYVCWALFHSDVGVLEKERRWVGYRRFIWSRDQGKIYGKRVYLNGKYAISFPILFSTNQWYHWRKILFSFI